MYCYVILSLVYTLLEITLIMKQIPHALGVDSNPEGAMAFEQVDGQNTFSEILLSFDNLAIGALLIFLVSMLILLVWELQLQFVYFNNQHFMYTIDHGITWKFIWSIVQEWLIFGDGHLFAFTDGDD